MAVIKGNNLQLEIDSLILMVNKTNDLLIQNNCKIRTNL